jgi:hypothetical protein
MAVVAPAAVVKAVATVSKGRGSTVVIDYLNQPFSDLLHTTKSPSLPVGVNDPVTLLEYKDATKLHLSHCSLAPLLRPRSLNWHPRAT